MTCKNVEEPKDLGVKIGSKKQALFIQVLKNAEIELQKAKENAEVNQEVINMCRIIIAKEKAKFK